MTHELRWQKLGAAWQATGRDDHLYVVMPLSDPDDAEMPWLAITTGPPAPRREHSRRGAMRVCQAWVDGDDIADSGDLDRAEQQRALHDLDRLINHGGPNA